MKWEKDRLVFVKRVADKKDNTSLVEPRVAVRRSAPEFGGSQAITRAPGDHVACGRIQ